MVCAATRLADRMTVHMAYTLCATEAVSEATFPQISP